MLTSLKQDYSTTSIIFNCQLNYLTNQPMQCWTTLVVGLKRLDSTKAIGLRVLVAFDQISKRYPG